MGGAAPRPCRYHAQRMIRPAVSLLVLVALLGMVAVGCGDDARTSTPAATDAPEEVAAGSEDATDDAEEAPSSDAIAADKRFAALVAAYAPVSVRVNFLVAAETLREDAVDSNAGEQVEQERFGAVRVERERMLEVLRTTRPRVAAVPVATAEQQHVKALLLTAIDARRRALNQLGPALDAQADETTPDTDVEARVQAWEASWNESLRAAREATSSMQETRARLGLEPGPEEAFR